VCEKVGVKIWPVHLPWLADVALGEGVVFLLRITEAETGMPSYEVVCKTLLGELTDECIGLVSGLLENMATSTELLAIFSLTEIEKEREELTCIFTKEKTAHLQGEVSLTVAGKATAAS